MSSVWDAGVPNEQYLSVQYDYSVRLVALLQERLQTHVFGKNKEEK
jgi:hypothetical protein